MVRLDAVALDDVGVNRALRQKLNAYTRAQFSVIHPGGAVGERLASEKEVL